MQSASFLSGFVYLNRDLIADQMVIAVVFVIVLFLIAFVFFLVLILYKLRDGIIDSIITGLSDSLKYISSADSDFDDVDREQNRIRQLLVMPMNFILESLRLLSLVQGAIFRPKAGFEGLKRFLTRRLLWPAVALLGAETLIVSILSAIGLLQFHGGGYFFLFTSATSDTANYLIVATLVAYAFSLGCNIYYDIHLKKTDQMLAELHKSALHRQSYLVWRRRV